MFEKINKIKEVIVYVLSAISGFAVTAMMFLTCSDVIARNVFKTTVNGAYETTQYILMPLAVFLALPAAYNAGIMPRVGDLVDKASEKVRGFIKWTVCIVELIIYGLLTYGGIRFTRNGFATKKGVPMGTKSVGTYPVYIVVPIGFALVVALVVWIYIIPAIRKKKEGATE